jgi:glucose-6-phosphate 1-dehydrogenase
VEGLSPPSWITIITDHLRTWQIFTPILHWIDGLEGEKPKPLPYPYGARGPKELDAFIAKYGYKRVEE